MCYTLKCSLEHEFEVWFNKGADFDTQSKKGLVECPFCGDKKIEKAPMAPAIKRSRHSYDPSRELSKLADDMRKAIETHCEDVGDNFANEARAIHEGQSEVRGIYGEASDEDVKSLLDDGIDIAPLPPAIAPKRKKKLN
ncbi:MAG TPA: DUF1178 family protein [Hellea balneolensis]|uniref:DUF1178 family protein n=1 Tax=Hellea balneolensis TaxID=287478 RepID=A0A7C5LVA6_9PROT|nr:DUF1178 family protein [Hellea balneolensis]